MNGAKFYDVSPEDPFLSGVIAASQTLGLKAAGCVAQSSIWWRMIKKRHGLMLIVLYLRERFVGSPEAFWTGKTKGGTSSVMTSTILLMVTGAASITTSILRFFVGVGLLKG
ncbi:hypothetical protein OH492_08110 [Vibrio chagasii]|nr:hypothetical protein [Vibrio chagasii]